MTELIIMPLWAILSIISSWIAYQKGYSAINFFVLALFLSPITALLCLIALPTNTDILEERKINNGTLKQCLDCRAAIPAKAHICKYCKSQVGFKN